MKLLKQLLFSILLLIGHGLFSQQVRFEKVISAVGGFANFVGGITQDKSGYMWFATAGGLFRYDGYKLKRYSNNALDASSLTATHLETLIADRKGRIWIATWVTGLDLFDPVTEKFTHFRRDPADPGSLSSDTVRAIFEDHEGVIWIGTHGGLDKYDPATNKFQHYRHKVNDRSSLSCDRVRVIYEDKKHTLWVGTGSTWFGESVEPDEGGLNRFDQSTGKFISFLHDPNDPRSLINNKVKAVLEDSQGNFWVGTAGDGLHTMDRATGSFERHRYDPNHPEKLSRPPVYEGGNGDHITFITEDALHNIWIGTLENGINKYDPKIQKVTHYGYADSLRGFIDNSGWCCYNSNDGILWMSAYLGSLYRIDPFHNNIPYVGTMGGVNAFAIDSANNFWIGTGSGLILKNERTGSSKKFVHDGKNKNSINGNVIFALCTDKEGTIWVGSINGLNRFNAKSGNFTRYINDPSDSNSITAGPVYAIQAADENHLWVGTNQGLNLMNTQTGKFIQFKNDPADSNSLSLDLVLSLMTEKSGNLWVGIYLGGGLNYFDHTTGKFKHFLRGLSVYSLLRDASGTMWVGTDDGLYKSDDGNKFTKVRYLAGGVEINDGLSLQEDDQKNIWVSSSSGIFKISHLDGQTNSYITEANLSISAGYKTPDGKIYFGDGSGYYAISPNDFSANTTPPQIVLTHFSIGGKPVVAGEKSVIGPSLGDAKKILLRHDQNVFTFEFAGLHYSDPGNNYHLYMLENYDQKWHEAGAERSASYFNVPPGRYVLHVKVANSDGVWAERAIEIIISPPWWRTWWAYCIYGLLFAVSALFVHRYQKDRVIKKERERTRARELAQAKEIEKAYNELKTTQTQLVQQEKMASLGELTAGVAHEIQNPLNFVNNFSEVNSELITEMKNEIDKGNFSEARSIAKNIDDNEQKIMFHGKRADAIVKSMLQHSRASSGQKEPTDINALADEYLRLAYHGLRAKDKTFNAKFETDFDPSIEKISVVPQDIGRVILNLISNAFYAVNEKSTFAKATAHAYEPTVSVSTKKIGNKISINVKDNGKGIPQKVLDKIFQPFFTTKPTGQGTGLGLSLAYDIIKAHGGEIKVETKEGEGSEFKIVIQA